MQRGRPSGSNRNLASGGTRTALKHTSNDCAGCERWRLAARSTARSRRASARRSPDRSPTRNAPYPGPICESGLGSLRPRASLAGRYIAHIAPRGRCRRSRRRSSRLDDRDLATATATAMATMMVMTPRDVALGAERARA
eukprot:scaffold4756_cov357-Prasinococcus_capsulatus_cf.AAC.4